MKTCAMCVELVPASSMKLEPLGKNDAMVLVCRDCATDEKPVAKFGPERGYTTPIGFPTAKEMKRAVRAAFGVDKLPRNKSTSGCRPLTPGHIMVRIRRVRGHDAEQAKATLAHVPWHHQLSYLGSTNKWFVFERPDPKANPVGFVHKPDPLEPIAHFKVGEHNPRPDYIDHHKQPKHVRRRR